jgi:hypothetical protein
VVEAGREEVLGSRLVLACGQLRKAVCTFKPRQCALAVAFHA